MPYTYLYYLLLNYFMIKVQAQNKNLIEVLKEIKTIRGGRFIKGGIENPNYISSFDQKSKYTYISNLIQNHKNDIEDFRAGNKTSLTRKENEVAKLRKWGFVA